MNRDLSKSPAALSDRTYQPIENYAAIGDCHGVALVARDGGIDWCAFERMDAPPVFCRLLDRTKGGFLSVRPAAPDSTSTRSYVPNTNILLTRFVAPNGGATVTDFMPVGRRSDAGAYDYVSLVAPGALVRRITCVAGELDLEVCFRASLDFARVDAELAPDRSGIAVGDDLFLYSDLRFEIDGCFARSRTRLRAGERRFVVLARPGLEITDEAIEHLFATTRAFWREWLRFCRYDGPYGDALSRSALVLKLLTFAPSGAIVAAPTTSLPETIGGERNWDYRFSWVRDAALTLYALASLGYSGEVKRFFEFLHRSCAATHPDIGVAYGVAPGADLTERRLEHLEGYAASRPVRSGNAAAGQHQWDVYGHIFDAALVYERLGGVLTHDVRPMLFAFVEVVEKRWQEPDHGIWESRDGARQFVHSKLMCWVAVDRAIRIFGGRPQWLALRDAIARKIEQAGIDEVGFLKRGFEDSSPDAALLLAPMLDLFLPPAAEAATIDHIQRELQRAELLYRYRSADGLVGEEGGFLACSFWLVDALLAQGRGKEARSLFERLLERANDVGLYAEEADIGNGRFLGNFPQALTHLGLISSAINLRLFERGGAGAVRGTYADRARRSVRATFGWRGILAALLSPRHSVRLLSSSASKLRTHALSMRRF